MVRGPFPRHARPSGRAERAAAYDAVRAELASVRTARWNDQLETVRLTALTEQLSGQVATLQEELAAVRLQLEAARSVPPLVVEVPTTYVAPPAAAPPASAGPPPPSAREELLLVEMAELRRLVAHQQQLLADLTVRLLDLLARFVPGAPAAGAPSDPYGGAGGQQPGPAGPGAGAVLDDETATRLRVIREAFGR